MNDKKNENKAQSNGEQCEVMTFQYSESKSEIQSVLFMNEPWLVAADLCSILDLSNVTKALNGLDEDEKLTLPMVRAGQMREVNCVNESGFYNLVFKSRKPEAKAFRKWVTSEVLPAIRKKGYYGVRAEQKADFIDARDVPYQRQELNGVAIRCIEVGGETWFSLNDIHRAIGSSTESTQAARKLNKKKPLAQKIWLFGNTHPSWFTNSLGLHLLATSSRKLTTTAQLQLNFGGQA